MRKEMVFYTLDGQRICFTGERKTIPSCMIATLVADKLIRKGCEAFLACAISLEDSDTSLADISVVCRFPDVFFEELLGLTPTRKIEFSIDLVSVIRPMSRAPYRMAPIELKEFKAQL